MASPNVPNVEIISDCFVKPKFVSEEAKKPMYFSPWDLVMISFKYIQNGLLFRLPENQDFSITTFLDDLKDSLSATLTHFHPLAARLSTVKHENPSSFTIFMNPENSPGARFIHSAVNLTVDDILTPTDVPLIVQSFFDHHKAINHDGHELSLLSVKVTELVDGIFIGLSINHMVVDGTSFWHFFNSWSEMFKSKLENANLTHVSRPPILKRWIPEGSDPIITLPFTNEDQFISRPDRAILRERIFHFSSDSLSKLKAKVNSECSINTRKISTLQSLSAVVWRCVTRARHLPPDQVTIYLISANNRSRISPPVPENYFGNMIQPVREITTAGELLDHGVGWAALRLHEAVVSHDDTTIKNTMNLWVKSPFVIKPGQFHGNSVGMGCSPRFDMYGNEFGLGKALLIEFGFSRSFRQASPCLSAFAAGRAAALKMFETINRKPKIDAYDTKGRVLRGDIELTDVYFTYPARPGEEIFSGFSLYTSRGTTASLVGQSGNGKSTVITLIERFYDPKAWEFLLILY